MIDNKPHFLEMAGNLIPIAKTEDQLRIVFRAFFENRLAFPVRIRDLTKDPSARLSFMHEPRDKKGQPSICTLLVSLPNFKQQDLNGNFDKTGKIYLTSGLAQGLYQTVLEGAELILFAPTFSVSTDNY